VLPVDDSQLDKNGGFFITFITVIIFIGSHGFTANQT
jgi:hypothetical protein